MNREVFDCKNCGYPLSLEKHQIVIHCSSCGNKFFINQDSPPAVVMKPEIDMNGAREIIYREFKSSDISRVFAENSTFKRAVLYYIPFFEVRVAAKGSEKTSSHELKNNIYSTYDYMDPASDLEDLEMGYMDSAVIQDSVLGGQQIPFDPAEMRRSGRVVPADKVHLLKAQQPPLTRDIIEDYNRIVYFPVWEVTFSYTGINFKSYLSAVDGRIFKLRALGDHRKKILLSMLGLLFLAILLGRGQKEGTMISIFTVLLGIPMLVFLFPFFWRIFSYREIVEKVGSLVDTIPVYYVKNSFVMMTKEMFRKIFRRSKSRGKDD